MLNFGHLVFYEVAKLLSFSKASEILFISQPSVSKHVKNLEAQYGIALFERKGNTISLTEEGSILFKYLSKANEINSQLEFDISILKNTAAARGTLVIGASTTVALYLMPKILSGFHKAFPEIKLRLINRNSENILKALLNHEIDVGIIEGKNKTTLANYQFFLKDEIVAVCSATSSLIKKPQISITELVETPIALREKGSGTLAVLTAALEKENIKLSDLNTQVIIGGTEALKNFLLEFDCIGFLPTISVQKQITNGELVRINIPELIIHREFYFIQRQGEENNKLIKLFIKHAANSI